MTPCTNTVLVARVWDGITPVPRGPLGQPSSPFGPPSTQHHVRISKPVPIQICLLLRTQGPSQDGRPKSHCFHHIPTHAALSRDRSASSAQQKAGGRPPRPGAQEGSAAIPEETLLFSSVSSFSAPFLSHPHPNHQKVQLALPSKDIQNPTTSHSLQCHHPGPSHHHPLLSDDDYGRLPDPGSQVLLLNCKLGMTHLLKPCKASPFTPSKSQSPQKWCASSTWPHGPTSSAITHPCALRATTGTGHSSLTAPPTGKGARLHQGSSPDN